MPGRTFRHKNAMGDPVTTTRKTMPGDMESSMDSSREIQAVCASSRPAVKPRAAAEYYTIVARPMRTNAQPIFTAELLEFKRDKKSSAISFAVHAVIIFMVLSLTLKNHTVVALQPAITVTPVDFTLSTPAITLPVAKLAGGGGGGGAHEMVEAIQGQAPTIVKFQTMAPQIIRVDEPKLATEPTMLVRMPESSGLPTLGVAHSQQIALASQGRGSGSGFGEGLGGGIGAGHGTGAGPGSGGGYGGGIMNVGGGVSAPEVIHSVEPEFTEDARRANLQGSVSIRLIVDSQGNPQNVQLSRHLGMGLDEKALEAVRQYRFKPAMYQGHPVAVQIVIDIDFHLH